MPSGWWHHAEVLPGEPSISVAARSYTACEMASYLPNFAVQRLQDLHRQLRQTWQLLSREAAGSEHRPRGQRGVSKRAVPADDGRGSSVGWFRWWWRSFWSSARSLWRTWLRGALDGALSFQWSFVSSFCIEPQYVADARRTIQVRPPGIERGDSYDSATAQG